MGGLGSGRKPGSGGRQPGAKNVITPEVRNDILAVFRKLGGQAFLLKWAIANPDEFVKCCLMKLVPVPREDAPPASPAPIDMSPMAMREVAVRIGFILASADAAMPRPADVQMVELAPAPEPAFPYRPEPRDPAPLPPLDECPVMEPSETLKGDPEGIEETRTETIASYRGSPGEQGRSDGKHEVIDRRGKAHGEYMAGLAVRHRRDLL